MLNTPTLGSTRSRKPFDPRTVAGIVIALVVAIISGWLLLPAQHASPDLSRLTMAFVPNVGQTAQQVRYQTSTPGGTAFFTEQEIVISLPREQATDVLRISFDGSNTKPTIEASDRLPGVINFLLGQPTNWKTNVPTFGTLQYREIYPGITLQYEGTTSKLKSTFTVDPGVNPQQIRWRYQGTSNVTIDGTGALQIRLNDPNALPISESAPIAWQDINNQRIPVVVAFQSFADGSFGFQLGAYDQTYPLVIDPVLNYSTYLNGPTSSGNDIARDVAIGPSGVAYVTGQTFSSDFPVNTSLGTPALPDAFVMRIDPAVSGAGSLLSTTIIGGSASDAGYAIAVDSTGQAFVAGETSSANFPTQDPLDTYGGSRDAFVIALNPTGTALTFGTFLGGIGSEAAYGVALNAAGNRVYVTGEAASNTSLTAATSTFQVTSNATQASYSGGSEAFISVIANPTTSPGFVYSSYITGNNNEIGNAITVGSDGHAYVVGTTNSFITTIPTTSGAYDTTKLAGDTDAFLLRINPDGTSLNSLVYATFLGGALDDIAYGVAVSASGQVFVAGTTSSTDFPTTTGVYQSSKASGTDAFVARLSTAGSGTNDLIFGSYFGGNGDDSARDIAIGNSGALFVAGASASSDIASNAAESSGGTGSLQAYGGSDDAFVAKFSQNGTTRFNATYLGGSGSDIAYAIAVDASDQIYLAGSTNSTNYYTLPGAPTNAGFQTTGGGASNSVDGFFAQLLNAIPVISGDLAVTVNEGNSVTITTTDLTGIDADDIDASLSFALTDIPDNGNLRLNSTNLALNATFTVDDLINGRISYLHNGSETTSDSLQVTLNDGTATTAPSTLNITINPVNDPPVNTVPGPQTTNEDTALVIAGISIADPDSASSDIQLTLSATNGTISVSTSVASGITAGQVTGNGSASVVITAPLAAINTTLTDANGVTYTPTSNYNGSDTLTVATSDQGNTGSGGALTDSDTVTITVNAVNDAPVNTVPGPQTTSEDTALVIAGISITDIDAGSSDIQLTLSATNGTISVSTSVASGITAGQVTGNGSASVIITAPLAAINTTLADASGVTYTPTSNYNGSDTLTVATSDQGNTGAGGALTDSDTITITVNAVNDAPVNTVPAGPLSTSEDTSIVVTGISVADIDAGGAFIQVTISAINGRISIDALIPGGVDFGELSGNGSSSVTMTASRTAINTTLAAATGVTYTPNTDYNGSDTITVATNDQGNTGSGGALSDSDTIAVNISAVNDAPVNTVPGPQTTSEDTALVFSTANSNLISVSDVDIASSTAQVVLTATNGTITLSGVTGLSFTIGDGTGDTTMTFTGTVADINTALNGMSYTPTAEFSGSGSLQIAIDDQGNTGAGGALTDSDTITITVSAVNDGPTNTVPGPQTTSEDTALVIAGISITDIDAGSSNVQLTLSATNGTISVSTSVASGITAGQVTGNGSASVIITAPLAAINTTLADASGVTYTPTSNYNGSDTLTVATSDQGNTGAGGALSDSDTIAVNISAVNDAPVNTVPGPQTTSEDTALVIAGISITDIDAGSSDIQLTLSATNGTISVSTSVASGITAGQVTGNGSASVVITAPLAAINTTLADANGVTYTPTSNYNGSDTLTVATSDQGNTGAGGALTDSDTITITVSAVNDGPTNTVPGPQTTSEDTALVIAGISITDIDAGSSNVQLTLSATNGTISVSTSVASGITAGQVTGNGSASVVITAPLAAINTTLTDANGVTYTPTSNYNGSDTLTVATSDQGNTGSGGALSDSDTIAVNISAVNDAPVNTVPGPQTTSEDTALVFSTANSNLISVSDVDIASSTAQVVLTATNGTITLSGVTGLSFTIGDGTGDTTMTFTGTVADINTALNGMSYTPTAEFSGSGSLQIAIDDQGNTGAGGALTDSDTITITVSAVNDGPTNTVPGPQTTSEDTALVIAGISITDIDAGSSNVQLTLSATNGTISVSTSVASGITAGQVTGNGSASVIITAPLAAINTTLADANGVTYTPTSNYNGSDTLTVATSDQGNTGSGGALSDSDTIAVNISAVNDAPVNTVPGPQTTSEDTALVFSTANSNLISVSDVDIASSTAQVVLTATNGTITLSGVTGLSFTIGDGTGDTTMTFTGTVADINTALNGMSYTPTAEFSGSGSLQIAIDDQGNTGAGGALTDSDTIAITITGVNDAPVITITGTTLNYTENGAAVNIDTAASVNDVDSADFNTGSLTIGILIGGDSADTFTINNQGNNPGEIGVSGNQVLYGGSVIGTFSGGSAGTPLVITFSSTSVNPTVVVALIGQIRYSSTSDAFADAIVTSKSLQVVLNDGDGDQDDGIRPIDVTGVNDAPSIDNSGTMILNAISENPTTNTGTLVSAIIASAGGNRITDPDTGALEGIAVIAVDQTNGIWEYSTNGGSSWSTFTSLSATQATLLAADSQTRIRFVPNLNFNGLVDPGITFRAWDQSSGSNGATGVDITPGGGTSAFSAAPTNETASISVTGVNQAPVLDNSFTLSLNTIAEDIADATNTGTLITTLLASGSGDPISDVDAGALEGIAIIGSNTTNGSWQFSINNGSTWTNLGTPSNTAAVLLAADSQARIRFIPNVNFNGTITAAITFRAWDQTSGASGATGVDVSTNGDPTAFSSNTETAQLIVTPVNDPPTAVNDRYQVAKDSTNNTLAVLTNDQISPDSGETLTVIDATGAQHGTLALAIDGSAVIYTPTAGYEGADSFTYTISDGNGGTASATVTLQVGRYFVSLPLVLGEPTQPDLTISDVTITPAGPYTTSQQVSISVTVTNNGSLPTGGFFVDLYINPSVLPDRAGILWENVCSLDPCYGISWYVSQGLGGGKSITLTSTPNSYYTNTRWNGGFAAGTTDIYVLADSWNGTITTGAVTESDETNNLVHISGIQVTGTNTRTTNQTTFVNRPLPRSMPR